MVAPINSNSADAAHPLVPFIRLPVGHPADNLRQLLLLFHASLLLLAAHIADFWRLINAH